MSQSQTSVDLVVEKLAADRGTLYMLDRNTGELFSRAAHLPELDQIRLPKGKGVAGHVAQSGKLVVINDVRSDAHFFPGIDRMTGYVTRSMMAAPVFDAGGELCGVLQVINSRRGRFSGQEQQLLRKLARTLAPSLCKKRRAARGQRQPVVGDSPCMRQLDLHIGAVAQTDVTVLLSGETGTGKSLIARQIHHRSPRARGPLVEVDCTSLPAGLIESELFGHERGAFTGADRRVVGKFEQARGGTLFLDEIGELPPRLQGKLLRFLQEREFERVGGRETLFADVRVVTATNTDLQRAVLDNRFRQDLYYRIRVVELKVPPLRSRGAADLRALVDLFMARHAARHRRCVTGLTDRAMTRLSRHRWPGNIRELEHCIESAVVLSSGALIEDHQLSLPGLIEADAGPPSAGYAPGLPLAAVERDHIQRTLEHCGDNRSEAARLLGIGRNTLLRKLRTVGSD